MQNTFHISAYTMLIGTVADTDVPAVYDQILLVTNNHIQPPKDMKLVAAAVMSPTLARVQLRSPKIQQLPQMYLNPLIGAALPPDNPNVMWMPGDNGFIMKEMEEIQMLGSAAPGTTERFTGVIVLQDEFQPIPGGDSFWIRGTSTSAATANTWSDVSVSWTSQLNYGKYAIVGFDHQSTNGQAFRLIIDDNFLRPGFLSRNALTRRNPYEYYAGILGSFGEFRSTNMPRVQVLCNAADASHDFLMKVVKIG